MKRVIKYSFGPQGQDWIDPDTEPNVVDYEDTLTVTIDKTLVHVEPDGTANESDMYELLDSCVKLDDLWNDSWGFLIVDDDKLKNTLWDEIEKGVSDVGVPGGSCYVSGKVDISYSYGVVEPEVRGYGYVAELEAWDSKYYYEESVTVDSIDVSGIKVERV